MSSGVALQVGSFHMNKICETKDVSWILQVQENSILYMILIPLRGVTDIDPRQGKKDSEFNI